MNLPDPIFKRRKPDGTEEWIYDCPLCGSSKNMEVNPQKGKWKCWACGQAGATGTTPIASVPLAPRETAEPTALDLVALDHRKAAQALAFVQERGADPAWLAHRYGVQVDLATGRLAWPLGNGGYALRAASAFADKKVLIHPPRGVIGYPRLSKETGGYIVVTEGDFKAASIPLPWVGLGIMGVMLSNEQKDTIKMANPKEVIVCLDAGYKQQAETIGIRFALDGITVKHVTPDAEANTGPDDWPRNKLVRWLEEAT